MKVEEAKKQFIQEWGILGTKWGIKRTMAQVHALLLISPESMSADDIMEALNMSRGNANMNLRALIDWGLIRKTHKPGERREFFYAEKDLWKVSKLVLKERKRRELDPVRNALQELQDSVDVDSEEAESFHKTMSELNNFADTADTIIEKIIRSDQQWLFTTFMKFMGTK